MLICHLLLGCEAGGMGVGYWDLRQREKNVLNRSLTK
jgi:hypothetical protein